MRRVPWRGAGGRPVMCIRYCVCISWVGRIRGANEVRNMWKPCAKAHLGLVYVGDLLGVRGFCSGGMGMGRVCCRGYDRWRGEGQRG